MGGPVGQTTRQAAWPRSGSGSSVPRSAVPWPRVATAIAVQAQRQIGARPPRGSRSARRAAKGPRYAPADQQHMRKPRMKRQTSERPSMGGNPPPGVQRPEGGQQARAPARPAGGGASGTDRSADPTAPVRAPDRSDRPRRFRAGERGQGPLLALGPQPVTAAGRDTARPSSPLGRLGPRDPFGDKARHARPGSNRARRARPASTTTLRMSGRVSEVSAIEVASTILRRAGSGVIGRPLIGKGHRAVKRPDDAVPVAAARPKAPRRAVGFRLRPAERRECRLRFRRRRDDRSARRGSIRASRRRARPRQMSPPEKTGPSP